MDVAFLGKHTQPEERGRWLGHCHSHKYNLVVTSDSRQTTQGILGSEHRKLTVGIVATVSFIAFEAMAVATAMPRAVPDLDGLELYAFAFSAFFTTSLFAMVVAGEVCDRRGPLLPLVSGGMAFSAGLLLAGAAQSMWPFIAGRAIQGLGGGLAIVSLYVVVGRAYDESVRPRVFAVMSAAWVVPSIVGPVIAGALADHASWRWVFLGIAPLVLVPIVLATPSVKAVDGPPQGDPIIRAGRKRFALATAVGMGLLQYAGTRPDLVALGIVVIAIALLVPNLPKLFPAGTLRLARGLPTVIAMRGIFAGSFFGAEAFLPLMLVTERGVSTTMAGLALTGAALGWSAGSWYQGRPGLRTPRFLLIRAGGLLVGGAISAIGLVLVPSVPFWASTIAWTIGAVGMGMAMASISVTMFELSPPRDHGANSAALQLSDAMFSIVFVGMAATIFGTAHGAHADEATIGVANWVYLVILGVMAALAWFGAWAAGRIPLRQPSPR